MFFQLYIEKRDILTLNMRWCTPRPWKKGGAIIGFQQQASV